MNANSIPFTFTTIQLLALCISNVGADETQEEPPMDTVTVVDKAVESNVEANITKLSTSTFKIPVSVEIIGNKLVNQYGNESLSTLLGAGSSALVNSSEGGRANQILLRGFSDTAVYRNGINDSFGDRPPRELVHVERIEILKGPNSALYGPGEPGGAINYVTKKPESIAKSSASAAIGTNSFSYFDFDSTGPISHERNISYRVIGSRRQSDTFREFVKTDKHFISGGLSWGLPTKQLLELSVEYSKQEKLHDTGVLGSAFEAYSPQETYFGEPQVGAQKLDNLTLDVRGNFALNGNWQLSSAFTYQRSSAKGAAVEPEEIVGNISAGFLSRELQDLDEKNSAYIGQLEIGGIFNMRGFQHDFLVGIETTQLDENVRLNTSNPEDNQFAISIDSLRYGAALPLLSGARFSDENREQYSTYLQDLVSIGDKWRLLLSARLDYIKSQGTDAIVGSSFSNVAYEVNPRIGIIYSLRPGLALFTSYSESLDPNEGLQPSGESLAPTRGQAVEIGSKWQSPEKKLTLNLSFFGIVQKDVTTDAPGYPGFEIQTARQINLGLDLSVETTLSDWFSAYLNYNYLESEITDDPEIINGTPPLNVPKHRFNILGLSAVSLFRPQDTSIGLNLSYVGPRQGSLEPAERRVKIPGFFKADLFIGHSFSERLQLSLRVENLGNTNYIQNSQANALHWTPGKPRSVVGQINFSF